MREFEPRLISEDEAFLLAMLDKLRKKIMVDETKPLPDNEESNQTTEGVSDTNAEDISADRCQACHGEGLKDQLTICPECNGDGKSKESKAEYTPGTVMLKRGEGMYIADENGRMVKQ